MMSVLSKDFLVQLGNQYGTPLYVYDAERIKEQFEKLRDAFSSFDATIFYACKALTNINVLKHIMNIGCNVDCSSSNEVLMALHAGFPADRVLYTSNNISFEELQEVASHGVNINIDSISNLRKFGQKYGASYPVGIRLRPNIMAGGNMKISVGHDASKFGIPLEQINEVHDIVKETGIVVKTLHIHTGSDIKDVDVFLKGVEVLYKISEQFPSLENLDMGGGFKVRYKPDDHATDVELLGKKLGESIKAFEKLSGRKLKFWFEPGKFIVSEAGYFITKVNVIKQTPNITFVGLNTGLNHLIRPMFYDAWQTIENISNPSGEKKKYNITGNICETDTFATDREVNEIREGDYLVFKNAGAYCFEMSSNYNSRYKPAEILVEHGQSRIIRKADVFDDLLRNQII
ncbi:MAG: diaminopimelate decarboxylase [Chitinophagaceae bacterium]|nr:diaminopimelate decarboxylase [Chitinophagaceae bacterium]